MTTYTQVLENAIQAKLFKVVAVDTPLRGTVTAAGGQVLSRFIATQDGGEIGGFDRGTQSDIAMPLHESCYPLTVTIETEGRDPRSWAESATWIE